jgi:SAM-dependent methyltransferase
MFDVLRMRVLRFRFGASPATTLPRMAPATNSSSTDHSSPAGARAFYDSEYHFTEDVERPDERRIWRAMKHQRPLRGMRFLDLGCGAGWATRLALRDAPLRSAVGLDFSRTALALARRHSAGEAILWVQADGTALPVRHASVDRLFCNGALEHFPDINRGLSEIHRVLSTDGRAVLIVPNFYVRTEQPMEFRTHYRGWKRLFGEHGLALLHTGTDWGPPVLKNANLPRAAARLAGKIVSALPFMQYQFIFVLEPSRGAER